MMGESFHTMELLAEFAQSNKIRIAFNPSSYLAQKGISYLKDLISKAELLILNKEEALTLAGNDRIENVLKKLRSFGPKVVVITDGKNEMHASDDKYIYSTKPPAVKVVDTTGAGDAFAASFLSGIIRKNDIEFAIKLGIVNSISVISHYGAKNILLNFKEAMRSIRQHRIRIHKRRI
jgi:ribokinase